MCGNDDDPTMDLSGDFGPGPQLEPMPSHSGRAIPAVPDADIPDIPDVPDFDDLDADQLEVPQDLRSKTAPSPVPELDRF